jgi:hypothetical protein
MERTLTPARAAEVLRNIGNERYSEERIAGKMGADALEFQTWLFGVDDWGSLRVMICGGLWHGEDSFLDYARAEWEKERKG